MLELEANRELAAKVADAIEKRSIEGLGFDMRYMWRLRDDVGKLRHPRKDRDCKAVGCVSAWALLVSKNITTLPDPDKLGTLYDFMRYYEVVGSFTNIRIASMECLNISAVSANDLFTSTIESDVQVVKSLRHLSRTGSFKSPSQFADKKSSKTRNEIANEALYVTPEYGD